ncbi:TetR family transcriptional regulator [Kribbella orskensis]|uniref:TetR family transcriptional regulator n=1 Tax=Kribbella orskensis TaxID=2512216 RepID=A0ABY2BM55_9ACTN|nr:MULTISPECIES: TetR/AcrR family transcriptional regulator [Kribbella]TCN40922.1 TetR family transcriptional regulator [Kribbella sp. VKM Ac-2500]TCO24174.1 TetR family transcriptional regulator [Kribbella orskensis]
MVAHQARPWEWLNRTGAEGAEKALTPAGERILTAASTLFYEQGIRAVGVDTIANAADVTKKTLYDRFGSKDNLIAAYLERRNRVWHVFLDEQLARLRPGTPEEVILALFTALTEWMAESRRGCGFINASVELAAPDHPAMPVIVAQKRWMRAEFVAQAKLAGFDRVEELADRLLLLHEGALVSYRVAAMEHAPEVAYRAAADLLASWPRVSA